ncbi:MAG: acyl carrier protein [Bacteriovorax sp.]|jgi:acyl carrier protein
MFSDINYILCEVFDVDPSQVTLTTSKDDLDEWDSMKQLELITALEKKFSIKFTMDEMISIDSVPKIMEAIEKRK